VVRGGRGARSFVRQRYPPCGIKPGRWLAVGAGPGGVARRDARSVASNLLEDAHKGPLLDL
jgi:hypothetical protein